MAVSVSWVVGNNAQHIHVQWQGCLSFTNSYYLRACILTRQCTRMRRVRWCASYAIRPLKASLMYWLVVPPLHRTIKYMTQHNEAVQKIIFFEILQDLGLVDSVSPSYSPLKPKPVSRRTMRKHSGMCPYLRSTKTLEPTEWILVLSTTSQSKSSRLRCVARGLQTMRKGTRRKPWNTDQPVGN